MAAFRWINVVCATSTQIHSVLQPPWKE